MTPHDASPLRRLAAATSGGAILGAVVFAVFAALLDRGRGLQGVIAWAILGAVLGAVATLFATAVGAVLRFAFGDEPSLSRQMLLGGLVAGAVGAASRTLTGLAVGVAYGVVMAAAGAAVLSLILRTKVIQDVRSEPPTQPPPVGRQVFRGSAAALAILLASVGSAVAAVLLTLLFLLTPLKSVGPTVLTASLLGSLVEPAVVVPYMILKAPRKTPVAAQWDD